MNPRIHWLPRTTKPVTAFVTPETTLSDLLSELARSNGENVHWADGPLATAIRDRRPIVLRDAQLINPRLAFELDLLSKIPGPIEIRRVY